MDKQLIIKILVTPKEFENYNSRQPKDDMELWVYAEIKAEFVRQAINTENPKMAGGLWIEWDDKAEVERLKKFIDDWEGHNNDCDSLDEGSPRTDCTCGYIEAREQALKG